MTAIWKKIRSVPLYGWITGFLYFFLQYGMYRLADYLSRVFGTINYAYLPKMPFIDDRIPLFAPFIVIYIFSYVFWIMGPIIASLTDKKNFINYIIGLSAAYIVGSLMLLLMPTYMDRAAEGLMEAAARPGIFNKMLGAIYGVDGGTRAFNLFPSFHCMISLYCYLGVRKRPEVSKGTRIYSLVMTVLICMSTVFTKQHYFVDILGGLSVSIICYIIVNRIDPATKILNRKLRRTNKA